MDQRVQFIVDYQRAAVRRGSRLVGCTDAARSAGERSAPTGLPEVEEVADRALVRRGDVTLCAAAPVGSRAGAVGLPPRPRAYNRPEYDEALAALQSLQHELEDRNQSAAGSLAEGLDETLTLHRLGVYGVLGRSLKTTNGLESINALIEERCAKVDHWQNSS